MQSQVADPIRLCISDFPTALIVEALLLFRAEVEIITATPFVQMVKWDHSNSRVGLSLCEVAVRSDKIIRQFRIDGAVIEKIHILHDLGLSLLVRGNGKGTFRVETVLLGRTSVCSC